MVKGSGNFVSEERTTQSFSTIEISAPVTANIHVRADAQPSVKLLGYESLLSEIDVNVEGNALKISSKKAIDFDTDKDVVAEIMVSSFSDLSIMGASDANVDGSLRERDFSLKISGAGDVSLEELTVNNLTSTISGAGDVEIKSGSANTAHFKISGAGKVDAYGLQANVVSAKVSGAGDMNVTALKTLEAKVSGAGTIRYKGQPTLKSETSGIGEIAAAD